MNSGARPFGQIRMFRLSMELCDLPPTMNAGNCLARSTAEAEAWGRADQHRVGRDHQRCSNLVGSRRQADGPHGLGGRINRRLQCRRIVDGAISSCIEIPPGVVPAVVGGNAGGTPPRKHPSSQPTGRRSALAATAAFACSSRGVRCPWSLASHPIKVNRARPTGRARRPSRVLCAPAALTHECPSQL